MLLFVEFDEAARFPHRAFRVEGVARVSFGRNAPGYDLQKFAAELYQKMVDDVVDLLAPTQAGSLSIRNYLIKQVDILFLLRRRVNQARVRRSVLGLELADRLKIAGVRDDLGEFLDLLELVLPAFDLLVLCHALPSNRLGATRSLACWPAR